MSTIPDQTIERDDFRTLEELIQGSEVTRSTTASELTHTSWGKVLNFVGNWRRSLISCLDESHRGDDVDSDKSRLTIKRDEAGLIEDKLLQFPKGFNPGQVERALHVLLTSTGITEAAERGKKVADEVDRQVAEVQAAVESAPARDRTSYELYGAQVIDIIREIGERARQVADNS